VSDEKRKKRQIVSSPTLRVLMPYVRHQWAPLGLAAAATVILVVADLGSAIPLAYVLDQFVETPVTGEVTVNSGVDIRNVALIAGGAVIALAAAEAFTTYESELRLELAGERIIHELRLAIYAQLQRLSIAFHHKQKTGDLVTRVTGDVDAVGDIFAKSLGEFISSFLVLLIIAGYFIYKSPIYFVLAFAIAPILALLSVWFKTRARRVSKRMRSKEGEIAARSGEVLGAIQQVQAFGSEEYEHRRMAKISEERWKAGVDASKIEGRYAGLLDFVGAISAGLVLTFGTWQVSKGQLSLGELTIVVRYAQRVYRPLRNIAREASRVSKAMARADRVAEILAADDVLPDLAHGYNGPRATGEIQLDRIVFGYEPDRPALMDVSLLVPAGQKLAVIGRSGAGKSTIAALIARFYDPQDGRILIDGRDARECSLRWLRNQVGLVLQESVLFTGTIAENIAYGVEADMEAVVATAKAAGAHDFIEALPDGYDTELGQRGVGLSGGQRQRIAIARTILRNPAILILDEPTTGLDSTSEAEVMQGLETLMQNRTTIMITHSLALAHTADRVVEIGDGHILRQGSPRELEAALRRIRRAEAEIVTAGRVGPPPDAALPQMPRLLDPVEMAPVLQRSLGWDAPLPEVRISYLRYKPHKDLVVHYDVTIDGAPHDAVAIITARRDLSRWATEPTYRRLAELVDGRAPALEPLSYDAELGAMIQWLPLDIGLPALAQEPVQLRLRLQAAGVSIPAFGEGARLLAYKPRRRAVLCLDGHVIKIYAGTEEFAKAVTGLEVSTQLRGVRVPDREAVMPELQLTCQALLSGQRPDGRKATRPAGAELFTLHTSDTNGLRPFTPDDQLMAAAASAGSVIAVAPELEQRLQALLRTLEATAPDAGPLRPSHGDFHANQLLELDRGLAVIDFDEMCAAPAALDFSSYIAHLVTGGTDDLDAAARALQGLVEGYGSRPRGVSWYLATSILRRSPFPFRFMEPEWPRRIESMVAAAEEALHL
jgi:ABC-type multidrug transport system fused ATPase/permease subunit